MDFSFQTLCICLKTIQLLRLSAFIVAGWSPLPPVKCGDIYNLGSCQAPGWTFLSKGSDSQSWLTPGQLTRSPGHWDETWEAPGSSLSPPGGTRYNQAMARTTPGSPRVFFPGALPPWDESDNRDSPGGPGCFQVLKSL